MSGHFLPCLSRKRYNQTTERVINVNNLRLFSVLNQKNNEPKSFTCHCLTIKYSVIAEKSATSRTLNPLFFLQLTIHPLLVDL